MGKRQKENRKKIKALKEAASVALPLIEEQLAMASKAINRAAEIANQYNVPFEANVSPLSQQYVPPQFEEMFNDIDPDIIWEITGATGRGLYHDMMIDGWEHSAVC